jgi:hypothetical protein
LVGWWQQALNPWLPVYRGLQQVGNIMSDSFVHGLMPPSSAVLWPCSPCTAYLVEGCCASVPQTKPCMSCATVAASLPLRLSRWIQMGRIASAVHLAALAAHLFPQTTECSTAATQALHTTWISESKFCYRPCPSMAMRWRRRPTAGLRAAPHPGWPRPAGLVHRPARV